ncbi:MAG TPA: nitroreductase family protein [Candidatus Acidoferrum sp.]|nr:nitroreductase family protein [Candidatus Acidoferrum sp.]
MASFQEVLRRRRMVRRFDQRPLERELLDRILESARHAPSAGFSQGFDFVVLEEPEVVSRFWKTTDHPDFPNPPNFLATAPPAIVLPLANKAAYLDRYSRPDKEAFGLMDESLWPVPYWQLDTAMAVMLILLAATDLGVGAIYFGIFYGEDEALRELGVPQGYKPIGAIGLGHPAQDEVVDLTRFKERRRKADDMVHRNGW